MSNPDQYTDADLAEYEAELNDIAADPNLSPDEKLDAIADAVDAEIDEITGSDVEIDETTGSAPTSAPGAADAPATADTVDAASTADTVDTAPEETPVTDPTAAPQSTDTATPTATADVIGDPATATYTSTTSTATTTTEVEVEGAPIEPDTSPAPDTAPAPETGSALNEAIGVDGTVDYYSPRDVDRDGKVDVIHSRVDGVDTITHVDEDGTITLVEQDTDFNGTYETAAAVRADGTVRVAEDLDDDGAVDLVTYHDPVTGEPARQDEIDGARITSSKFDTDGDGEADVHLVDSDGNGRFDTVSLDTDGDGVVNATLVDTNGDGAFDLISSDDDNDGSQESYLTSADSGAGSLGDISTFESLIPADDSYHTQAGADTYEPPVVDDAAADLA